MLLMLPMSATASFQKSEIIEAGQVAPFSGVLVPEDTYRSYQNDLERYQKLLDSNYSRPMPTVQTPEWQTYTLIFFGGIIAGIALN